MYSSWICTLVLKMSMSSVCRVVTFQQVEIFFQVHAIQRSQSKAFFKIHNWLNYNAIKNAGIITLVARLEIETNGLAQVYCWIATSYTIQTIFSALIC